MDNVKFSIICPIFNAEKFLERAVNSLLIQSYTNWELILVDDGSTDGGAALCDSYSKSDKRIKVIHQINQGQSKARLVGIEKSSGDYVLFLDSDDYFELTALKAIAEELSRNVCDLVLFDAKKKNGENLTSIYSLQTRAHLINKNGILYECFGKRTAGYFWTYCFKKDLFKLTEDVKIKFSNIKYSEDVYLINQIITNNVNSLSILPETLYVYVVNGDSITQNQTVLKVRDRFNVFNDVYKELSRKYKLRLNKTTKSNIGWTYLSFLSRAAKEYDFANFKETAKEIRSSYIFKHLSRFKKDKYNLLIHFLFKIRMYMRAYTIIRKH